MHSRLEKAAALIAAGNIDDAEKLCRSTLKLGKDAMAARRLLALCLYNRSVACLRHPDLHADAERLLREAAGLDPDNYDVQNNLGALLLLLQRPEEAATHFLRASAASPGNVAAMTNLALAQEEAGQYESASATLARLAAADPDNRGAYLLREAMMTAAVPPGDDDIARARQTALAKLLQLAQRPDLALADPLKLPATYFRFTYHGACNVDINRALAAAYRKACPSLSWVAPHVASWRAPRGRIRLGIASAFLRTHSIGSVARGFFEHIDRARFELIAVRIGPSADDATAREIDRLSDAVVQIPGSLAAAREIVAGLALDVLFYQDIGMEPVSYFLAFARLAPVQLTWFGHPDTSGIATVDWYLSAPLFEREAVASDYTERLALLPHARNMSYYRRPQLPPATETRHAFGLRDEQRVYCCPQQLFKIQPAMDRLFLEICQRDPAARVVLFEPREMHWRRALERRMAAASPLLVERVVFLPSMPHARYLRLLQLSDVVLDTVTFNGYNTTLEALAVGTPVVTLAGALQRQRFGHALYQAIGFTELVAATADDYAALACRVANDPGYRSRCCRQIESGLAPLFEESAVITDFQAVIEQMLERAGAHDVA